MQHQSRPYTYDDQGNGYPTGHASHHSSDYSLTTPAYPQYDTTAYYVQSSNVGGINESPHSPSYYRSVTPSLAHSRYTSTSRDPRYFSSDPQGLVASSPTTGSGIYPSNQYFSSQLPSNGDHRSHSSTSAHSQFIPTPSEMAHHYSSYGSMIPRSPTVVPTERYSSNSLNYPLQSQLLNSSQTSHRPSRISTSRPRSGTLGSSPTSPSGERFPCEKCGKTFSRSHDRKRHHETQHLATPIIHRCRWCEKEFSRADSLKRHVDNGCDEAP